jgi:hypothetical protein
VQARPADRLSRSTGRNASVSVAYAPFALVGALGYGEEEHLDVQFEYAESPQATAKGVLVGHGRATFINTVFGLVGREHGQPLKAFYSYSRRPNRSFGVLSDSPDSMRFGRSVPSALKHSCRGHVATRMCLVSTRLHPPSR